MRDKPRHLVIKTGSGGRPLHYWQPSRTLRRLGFRQRRLSDDPAVARREAEALNREADEYRMQLGRGAFTGPRPGTVSWLIVRYRTHDDFERLADSTRRRYDQCLAVIEQELGDALIADITPPVVQALKRLLARTPWQANQVLRVMRLLWSFGVRQGFCADNPCRAFRQLPNPPRQTVWTHEQEERFLAACHEMGRPSIALAYRLAVWTAQREGDVLRLRWADYDGEVLHVRQGKTGRRLVIPVVGPLRAALEAAPRTAETIVADERGRPWRPDHFRHTVRRIMDAAGIEGVRFSDTRRTAIVRLAEAGCTVPEISAISGHQIDYCQRVLETHLPRTRTLAERAMAKLLRSQAGAARRADPEGCDV